MTYPTDRPADRKSDPDQPARMELAARRRAYHRARKLRIAYQRRGDDDEVPELQREEAEAYARLRESLDALGAAGEVQS